MKKRQAVALTCASPKWNGTSQQRLVFCDFLCDRHLAEICDY
jgi:hypothetical protein